MCGQNSEIFTLCHRGSDVLKKSILLASEVADSFDKKALWAGMLHHSISLNLAVSFCIVIFFCAESISQKKLVYGSGILKLKFKVQMCSN